MIDGRMGEDCFHLAAGFRRYQLAFFQHVIETGHLQHGGAMGKVVQRIAVIGRRTVIFFSDPQTTVFFRVIQAVARRFQQFVEVVFAHTIKYFRGGLIG